MPSPHRYSRVRPKGTSSTPALGSNPEAKVWRGPAEMPWREAPSKIRDPKTGLLIEVATSSAYAVKTDAYGDEIYDGGQRMRSSRFFKARAREILARPDLTARDRERLLEMNRAACAVFRQAMLAGTLDKPVITRPTRKRKVKPRQLPMWRAIEWHHQQIEKLSRHVKA